MSNLGLKAAFKEDKFNLKTIAVLFILVDLSIVTIFIGLNIMVQFLYLLLYQASLIFALMVGLRGQGKYKAMMLSLQSIARNRDLSIDEREKRLVNGIHHHCLELGYIYEERNKKYGLFKSNKNKVPKKTKNIGGKKRMIIDDIVRKQLGYLIVGVWGFVGILLLDLLINLYDFSPLSIITIEGIWYCIDGFIFFYIHYVFKIEPVVATQLDGNTGTVNEEVYGTVHYEGTADAATP